MFQGGERLKNSQKFYSSRFFDLIFLEKLGQYFHALNLNENTKAQKQLKENCSIDLILTKLPENFKRSQEMIMSTSPSLKDILILLETDLKKSEDINNFLLTFLKLETQNSILDFLKSYTIQDSDNTDSETATIFKKLSLIVISLFAQFNRKIESIDKKLQRIENTNQKLLELGQNRIKIALKLQELQEAKCRDGVFDQKKDLRLLKRQKRQIYQVTKRKQNKANCAIFNEDFLVIFDSIRSNQRYVLCRDKIAHVVLMYTGLRVSQLKYVTLGQLVKFFNYEDLTISCLKRKKLQMLVIPIVKTAKTIIELARPFWEELISIVAKKGIIIDDSYCPYQATESELWGTNKSHFLNKSMSREQLTRRLNGQLKEPSMILSKKLTTHSYRRGLGFVVAKRSGLLAAKKILNHISISTTQDYLESDIVKKELLNLYNSGHNYINSKDFEDDNSDILSKKDFDNIFEEILKNDDPN